MVTVCSWYSLRERQLAEAARQERVALLEEELSAVNDLIEVQTLKVKQRGKTTGEQAYLNRKELQRLQEKREEIESNLKTKE